MLLREKVNIIRICAPVERRAEEEMNEFYGKLQIVLQEGREENEKTIIKRDGMPRLEKTNVEDQEVYQNTRKIYPPEMAR